MRKWDEIRDFVSFGPAEEAVLRRVRDRLLPHFGDIVRDFYAVILRHEGARRVFTQGEAQVARLQSSLLRWLEGLCTGPWDASYFQLREKIGRIHVTIGLEPRYMVLAMSNVRGGLLRALEQTCRDEPDLRGPASCAISRLCDMELAIMLETYAAEFSGQLARRERLAAIGQLSASISHEVKNPLGVITTSLYTLREHWRGKADDVERRHFDRILRSAEHANGIVTTLLELLRNRAPTREERDWGELVARAVTDLPIPPTVGIERILEPSAGRAEVDGAQVARVISNLVRNAAEASKEGGTVTVTASGDRHTVEATVRDRGPGLPPLEVARLFEPLFTTKQVGTGLGLALSKAIVEAHFGTIEAANHPEGGALFRVRLPRVAPRTELEATP